MLSHYRLSRPRSRDAIVIRRYDLPLRRAMLARRTSRRLTWVLRPRLPWTRAPRACNHRPGRERADSSTRSPLPDSGDHRAANGIDTGLEQDGRGRIQSRSRREHVVAEHYAAPERPRCRERAGDVGSACCRPSSRWSPAADADERPESGSDELARHRARNGLAMVEPPARKRLPRGRHERHALRPARPLRRDLLGEAAYRGRWQAGARLHPCAWRHCARECAISNSPTAMRGLERPLPLPALRAHEEAVRRPATRARGASGDARQRRRRSRHRRTWPGRSHPAHRVGKSSSASPSSSHTALTSSRRANVSSRCAAC